MKKFASVILCMVLIMTMALPVMAAEPKIIFTSDSNYSVGGTVTVDKYKTLESVANNGKSEEFNAFYEEDVQYYWMRNDSYYADGPSITLTEADKGCTFYCMGALYSDKDHTNQIGTIYSDSFTVPNSGNASQIPEITTEVLPNGIVGEKYYFQLECTDADVTFSTFRSSLPDGLYLTQHGEIEGIPTKAGMWYVVIMAIPEAGEDYACTAEYEFVIEEAGDQYTLEIMRLPQKTTYTAGEKLDMKGMWVRIWTPDGFIDSYDGKYLEYSKQELVTVGEQKIKITYEDAFEFFIVTVVAPKETEPEETEPAEATEETGETDTTEEGWKPGKVPNKNPGKDAGKDSEKDSLNETLGGEPGDTTTIGASGGTDISLIIIIILSVVATVAIAAVIVLLIKRKK